MFADGACFSDGRVIARDRRGGQLAKASVVLTLFALDLRHLVGNEQAGLLHQAGAYTRRLDAASNFLCGASGEAGK